MKNRKKICILTEDDVANRYGIRTYINQLVKSLSDLYDIYVITLYAEEKEYVCKKTGRVNYIYLPFVSNSVNNSISETLHARYYIRVAYIILSLLKTENESVHIHFNVSDKKLLLKLQEYIPNAYYIYTVHYIFWKSYQLPYSKIQQIIESPNDDEERRVSKKIGDEIFFMKQCNVILSLSAETTNILKNIYKISVPVRVISNGYEDLYDTTLVHNKYRIKKQFGFRDEEKIILFVGRVIPNKGILELVQAFRNVASEISNIRLVIVGEGCFDLCLEKISPLFAKVTFTGFIDHDLLKKLYLISDIGVLPSHFEECSCTIIEMMSAQLAIIVSNIPSFSILKETGSALFASVGSVEDIEKAIKKLLSDKLAYEQVSCQARQTYLTYYTFELFKEKMVNVYRK